MGYISKEGAAALKTYKYAGADLSLLYIHVLTPMNKFLIEFVPKWLAPNLITLIGFMFTISSFLLTSYYSPDFNQVLPSWVSYWVAFSMFAYQTIDNLDGRQARRTNSSSPLGLLFDHGVDALNTSVGALNFAAVFQTGITFKVIILWLTTQTLFFHATWEEYFTGELILPIVNGPSDGVMIAILKCILAAYKPGIWSEPIQNYFASAIGTQFADYQMNSIIVALVILTGIPTLCSNLYAVATKKSHNLNEWVFPKIFPFHCYFTLVILWFFYSPSQIALQYPRIFILGFAFLFAALVCNVMLAHLCSQPFRIFQKKLIPSALAVFISLYPLLFPGSEALVDEKTILIIISSFNFLIWLHFAVGVINEITTILGIRCFVITHKKEETKKQ